MSNEEVHKDGVKVYVRMHDGTRLLGSFYISEGERIQDVMNDSRTFLPLHALNDAGHYHMIMLSKRYIQQVEEVQAERDNAVAHVGGERRRTTDRRQGGDRREEVRATLELEDTPQTPQRRQTDDPKKF